MYFPFEDCTAKARDLALSNKHLVGFFPSKCPTPTSVVDKQKMQGKLKTTY